MNDQGTVHQFIIHEVGNRLDKAIAVLMPELSRSQAQMLIRDGQVTINGQRARPNCRLAVGDVVVVHLPPPPPPSALPEDIPLSIVYEDDDILVVDKPAGMVVHPAHGHSTGTLVNAVLGHAPELAEEWEETENHPGLSARPGIVHRLDKDTSGLIVIAKTEAAMRALQAQFKARTVEKLYLALVDGRITTREGMIEAPIGRDRRERKRMAIVRDGREAVTYFRVRRLYLQHTLVAAEPKTGRTHQLRLHLAFLGYPVVGDRVYGRPRPTLPLNRQFLHAAQLTLQLPGSGERVTFESPLAPELQAILDNLEERGQNRS